MRPVEDDNAPQMARLDPRVSRWRYRVERLMLTPLFRFGLRVVLPMGVAFGAGTAWFSVPENRDMVLLTLSELRSEIESRPEFQVKLMAIDGASDSTAEDIREILALDFPVSSFDLELDLMQETVIGLDPVKTARLRIREGGVLQVDVMERQPAVLWRTETGLEMLDVDGVLVGPTEARADRPDLPVIAGEGAELKVVEAIDLNVAAEPIRERLRGFERIGLRRWDVVLDRGQRIMLPETGAVQALERVIAMDQAVDMLARDLVTVDLRLPRRPTIRMTEEAAASMRDFKAIEAGGVLGQ